MAAGERKNESDYSNLEFLSRTSIVTLNLKPNEQSVVAIPPDAVGEGHTLMRVVALNDDDFITKNVRLDNEGTDEDDEKSETPKYKYKDIRYVSHVQKRRKTMVLRFLL